MGSGVSYEVLQLIQTFGKHHGARCHHKTVGPILTPDLQTFWIFFDLLGCQYAGQRGARDHEFLHDKLSSHMLDPAAAKWPPVWLAFHSPSDAGQAE